MNFIYYIARHAEALSNGNGITDGLARNAIAHTHVSADWTHDYSRFVAENYGNAKELLSHDPLDSIKDQYNNEVGRRIAEYIRANGLSKSAIDDLVMDALNNGGLIVDPANDPRVPNSTPPNWTGPSANWPGSSAGRDYSGTKYGPGSGGSDDDSGGNVWPPKFPTAPTDPLVLDLDGDGIELVSIDETVAHFDYDGDGFAEKTGWVDSSDGFLVNDKNSNGRVDGIDELFGNQTTDGFEGLGVLDSNGDGKIDSFDEKFSDLRVWRDLNGDGVSQNGELFTLTEANVASINLTKTPSQQIIEGNQIGFTGSFTRLDGTSGAAVAAFFQTDRGLTKWQAPDGFTVSPDTLHLPNLKGYGLLRDLKYEMTLDSALLESVTEFALNAYSMSGAQLRSQMVETLFKWAGVENVEAGSKGPNIDARVMSFLEVFFGSDVSDSPSERYAGQLIEVFETVLAGYLTRFLSLVPITVLVSDDRPETDISNPFLPLLDLRYNSETDTFDGGARDVIRGLVVLGPQAGEQAIRYYDTVMTAISGLKNDVYGGDLQLFKDRVASALDLADVTDLALREYVLALVQNGPARLDSLAGTNSADILYGGAQGGVSVGGGGDDIYIYLRGDADLTIQDESWTDGDRLLLVGIRPQDVSLERDGASSDLRLIVAETSPGANDARSIIIRNELIDWFGQGLEQIFFGDGTTWTRAYVQARLLAEATTSGDDLIFGYNGNDTLRGGHGNDVLDGGAGDDLYIWARGDGHDTIFEGTGGNFSTFDTLRLEGVVASDVTLSRNGNDVTLIISESAPGASDGGSVLLKESFDDWFARGVERIVFADGTIWTQSTIRSALITNAGTSGDDVIGGSNADDVISGGQGNDSLSGGAGNDTYIYSRGDGNDIIDEGAAGNFSTIDTLRLQGIAVSAISFIRNGNELTLVISESLPGAGDGGSVLLKNELDDWFSSGVENIVFDDGTVWTQSDLRIRLLQLASTSGNDVVNGFNTNDTIRGGAGDDQLSGGGGDDTYIWARGDGNDTIIEGWGGNFSTIDKLVLEGVNPTDVTFARAGNDITLNIRESAPGAGNGGAILLKESLEDFFSQGVETIQFADGTIWTQADLRTKWLESAATSGNDVVSGFQGGDILRGGAGDDVLSGGNSSDTYLYTRGDGNDIVNDNASAGGNALVLHAIAPSEITILRNGGDAVLLIGANGVDGRIRLSGQLSSSGNITTVTFDDGTVWTDQTIAANAVVNDGSVITHLGGAGNDDITGTSDIDVFEGGAGNDTLRGQAGNDVYRFGLGSGNDVIVEGNAFDGGAGDLVQLKGLNAADVSLERQGNNLVLTIISSGEILTVSNQFDGTTGIEQLAFADGSVWSRPQIQAAAWIRGTSGNDTLSGTDGDDVIDGRAGNDGLAGRAGSDTYIYHVGSGNDTISESVWDAGTDIIKLDGLNVSDVQFAQSGTDLLIRILSSNETLTVSSQFNGNNGIEQVVFANGTVWDRAAIQSASWILGTAGNDTLNGQGSAEVFDGLAGDDTLNGRDGGDTYMFRVGSGNDTISESPWDGGIDTLKLDGLNVADVEFSKSGTDLVVRLLSSNETVLVSSQFNGSNGIEQVVFADGTIWDRAAIQAASWILGTAGNDTITGQGIAEIIDGRAGDDTLDGRDGGDTYIFRVGSGNDTITESPWDGGIDTLKLEGLNASDVDFSITGSDLIVRILSSNETVKVFGQANGSGIEQVAFADGTIWNRSAITAAAWFRGTTGNDSITATSANDILAGGLGNDYLKGSAGNDVYVYTSGDGNDEIFDDSASTVDIDTLRFTDLNASDVTVSRNGEHLIFGINSTGQTIQVDYQFNSPTAYWGIEKVEFADGSSWDFATINANAWYRGTVGNDSINAASSNDTLVGGLGNDFLKGRAGNDLYIYASGDGNDEIFDDSASTVDIDTLRFTDLNASDVTVSRNGEHLIFGINSTGQTIQVDYQFNSPTAYWGIEKVEFADGSSWDFATINANAWYRGTVGNDSITASSWNDTIYGRGGNDFVKGSAGSDIYVYASGDGNDEVFDDSGSTTDVDILRFTGLNASDITLSHSNNDLLIGINTTGETIKVDYQFYSQTAGWGIEKIEFANGSSWDLATINASAWIRGTVGNDTISGTGWNDTIFGGAGNDALSGGAGDDLFVFRAGFGQDSISDFSVGHDKLEFGDGLFVDAAAAFASASASGSDTIITIDASTTVLLQNVALGNLHVDDFRVV